MKKPDNIARMMQPQPITTRRLVIFTIIAGIFFYLYGEVIAARNHSEKQPQIPISAEAKALAKTIPSIRTAEIIRQVKSSENATVLFIYASWCPYCKQQIQIIQSLQKQGQAPANILVVSIDRDREALAQYLLSQTEPFPTLSIPVDEHSSLQSWIQSMGGQFKGGIPFLAVITPDEKLVAQMPGLVDKATLITLFNQTGN